MREELESVEEDIQLSKEMASPEELPIETPPVKEEGDSFTSWLRSLKSSEPTPPQQEAPSAEKMRIKESKPVEPEKTTRKDDDLFGGIITETLAELLANQGQIEKAIKMYEKLSLIFPNKSAFFAAKIEQLKSNIT